MTIVLPIVVFTRQWCATNCCVYMTLYDGPDNRSERSVHCTACGAAAEKLWNLQWPCAGELLLPSQTQVQSVKLSFLSYEHAKTDKQRGRARRERAVWVFRGGIMGGKMDIFNLKSNVFSPSIDFKILRKIKNVIKVNLNFTIPLWGGHCYCSSWTSINPATPLNILCNSVNINTYKHLSMHQHLHMVLGEQLLLYRTKWLLDKPSAITLMQSALSIHTVAYVLYQQHNATELYQQLCLLSVGCCVARSHTKSTVT